MIEAPPPNPPRVVVHVAPELLADALTRVLRARKLDVSRYPASERRRVPRPAARFDLAVVSEDLAVEVEADRIIVLDQAGAPTAAGTVSPGASAAEGEHLARLLALIDDLLG